MQNTSKNQNWGPKSILHQLAQNWVWVPVILVYKVFVLCCCWNSSLTS
jgi:hypothetical protein